MNKEDLKYMGCELCRGNNFECFEFEDIVTIFRCKDCGGVSICEHDRQRSYCRDCVGNSICEHDRQRRYCKICKGSSICEHNKHKHTCKVCDFGGYLSGIVRSRIRGALKGDKKLSSKEYLCCSIEIFKKHIEVRFVEGMSWENHGKWEIDHIKPIKFKEDGKEPSVEEIIKRLHYTNTQPLWKKDNIAKGNRFVG